MEAYDKFISYIKEQGWTVKEYETPQEALIPEKYKGKLGYYEEIAAKYEIISNPRDDCWIILNETLQGAENSFSWNEYQKISLGAADGDEKLTAEINAFWDRYFPFILSVGGEYAYFAIDTENGHIIYGEAPFFEEPMYDAADSIEQFFEKAAAGFCLP